MRSWCGRLTNNRCGDRNHAGKFLDSELALALLNSLHVNLRLQIGLVYPSNKITVQLERGRRELMSLYFKTRLLLNDTFALSLRLKASQCCFGTRLTRFWRGVEWLWSDSPSMRSNYLCSCYVWELINPFLFWLL